MDDDGDELLMELLSYTCPRTGKKRTAGLGVVEPQASK